MTIRLDRWNSSIYTAKLVRHVTAEEYRALLRGSTVEINGQKLTLDDGPFVLKRSISPSKLKPGPVTEEDVTPEQREAALRERHYSPVHPGTGTDQSVHAGGQTASQSQSSIPSDIRSRKFFHGVSTTDRGEAFLQQGFIDPARTEQGKTFLAPVANMTYASQEPATALIYSVGGDLAGTESGVPEQWIAEKGRYGYIFEIDPDSLSTIQPDEDSIGEATWEEKYDWLNQLARRNLTANQFRKVMDGEYIYWAQAGKKLVPLMSQDQKYELIRDGANIANVGPLRFGRAWRIDKTRIGELPREPSLDDILRLAELVERHYSPIHPGTGTDQSVHAPGGGGTAGDRGAPGFGHADWVGSGLSEELAKKISDWRSGIERIYTVTPDLAYETFEPLGVPRETIQIALDRVNSLGLIGSVSGKEFAEQLHMMSFEKPEPAGGEEGGVYGFSDRSEVLIEKLRSLEQEILELTHERIVFVNGNGEEVYRRDGNVTSVDLPEEDFSKFQDSGAIAVHNHPSGNSLSRSDVITGWAGGLSEIHAYGDSRRYIVRYKVPPSERSTHTGRISDIWVRTDTRIYDENLFKSDFDNIFGNSRHSHWVLEAVAREAPDLIDYVVEEIPGG